ncbi:MAG: hypothetical protein ACTS4U_00015 [Candidatus Hodgkinia cicadicola]
MLTFWSKDWDRNPPGVLVTLERFARGRNVAKLLINVAKGW